MYKNGEKLLKTKKFTNVKKKFKKLKMPKNE